MLRLVLLSVLTGLSALISGCTNTTTDTPSGQVIRDIPADEAYALIEADKGNADFIIIDVRTPEEYAGGHIENAINIDTGSDTFRDDIDKFDKEKTCLIY